MFDSSAKSQVQQLTDRIAIEQVLARYCRGIDRCDADELARVFTLDANIDYGDGPKPPRETFAGLMAGLSAMRLTQHNIGNVICEIEGDRAVSESNCVALHILPSNDAMANGVEAPDIEMVVGGRYLDKLIKQAGKWRIAERLYIMDWNRQGPATMENSGGLYDTLARRGARRGPCLPSDPSYAWWAKNTAG